MIKLKKHLQLFISNVNNIQLHYYSNQHKKDETILNKVVNNNSTNTSVLTDTFGRFHDYLRISLTERCNLRCKYCMPSDGVQLTKKSNLLTTDEIIYLSRLFVQHGVTKIRLTGGEPTIRKDLTDIIYELKQLKGLQKVGITTNGLTLTKQLVQLQRAGLDLINISLDTLNAQRFVQLTRRQGHERVLAGIDLALQLDYKPKINCVIMKNINDDELIDFVELTKHLNIDVRFIEYMPFNGNEWRETSMVAYKDMLQIIRSKYPHIMKLNETNRNDTSKAYQIPNYQGQIGFITSMTNHFCNTCNRLRITADGHLKVCLFGNTEVSLRDIIRSQTFDEQQLNDLIYTAVQRKKQRHADFVYVQNKTNVIKDNIRISSSSASASASALLLLSINNNCNMSNMQTRRYYCNDNNSKLYLTHLDNDGKPNMVNVGNKLMTRRIAQAQCCVLLPNHIFQLIKHNDNNNNNNSNSKGNILNVSELAGIMAGKRTHELIPLCHSIAITTIQVKCALIELESKVQIQSYVECVDRTGCEIEALTACSIAALTIYDMCKKLSHDITISNVQLIHKSGGQSGIYNIQS